MHVFDDRVDIVQMTWKGRKGEDLAMDLFRTRHLRPRTGDLSPIPLLLRFFAVRVLPQAAGWREPVPMKYNV